jgi:hypothetical protein
VELEKYISSILSLLFVCLNRKKDEGQRVKNVTLKLSGVRKADKTIKRRETPHVPLRQNTEE